MNKINPTYPATAVVNALQIPDDDLVGKVVRFVNVDVKRKGTFCRDHDFEVVGCQRVWGYDADGKYTMIDGYRGIAIGIDDQFGVPFNRSEVEIVEVV